MQTTTERIKVLETEQIWYINKYSLYADLYQQTNYLFKEELKYVEEKMAHIIEMIINFDLMIEAEERRRNRQKESAAKIILEMME